MAKEIVETAYNEYRDLKYDNLVVGRRYSYKKLCDALGATYLGSYIKGRKKQIKLWSEFVDFEEDVGVDGKLNGKLIVLKIKNIVVDDGGEKVRDGNDDNSDNNRGDGLDDGAPTNITEYEKETCVRYFKSLERSFYNQSVYEIIAAYLQNGKRVEVTNEKTGEIEVRRVVAASKSKWKERFGLIAPQGRRYSNKLYENAVGQILYHRMIKTATTIFCRILKRFKDDGEESGLFFDEGYEVAYIDLYKPIPSEELDLNKSACVKYNDRYYKIKIGDAGNGFLEWLNKARKAAAQDLGFEDVRAVYGGGAAAKYAEQMEIHLETLYYNENKSSVETENSDRSNDGDDNDESNSRSFIGRYKVINFWETLVVSARADRILTFTNFIYKQNKRKDNFSGITLNNYIDDIQYKINKEVLKNLKSQINQDNLIPNVKHLNDGAVTTQDIFIQVMALWRKNKDLFRNREEIESLIENAGINKEESRILICKTIMLELAYIFDSRDDYYCGVKGVAALIKMRFKDAKTFRQIKNDKIFGEI